MGLGLIGSLIGGVFNLIGASIQAGAEREAAAENREANEIQKASSKVQSNLDRRAAVRQERIKRAAILQESINTGVGGSSGESGAIGSLGGSLSSLSAEAIGKGKANEGINLRRQNAEDIRSKGRATGAIFSTIGSLFG